ncbi:MAG: hypothetical protein GY822_25260 [Deltaproteobacteria bacterium]|nr:hypothetical protein [Deltaproteobacteria bacterium]
MTKTFTPIQQEVLIELFNEGVNCCSNDLAAMINDAEVIVSTPLPRTTSIHKILSHKSSSDLRVSVSSLSGGICGDVFVTYPYEEMVPIYFELQRKESTKSSMAAREPVFLQEISEMLTASFLDSMTKSLNLPPVKSSTRAFMSVKEASENLNLPNDEENRYCLCARVSLSDADKSVIFYVLFNEQSLFLAQELTRFMKAMLRPAAV